MNTYGSLLFLVASFLLSFAVSTILGLVIVTLIGALLGLGLHLYLGYSGRETHLP